MNLSTQPVRSYSKADQLNAEPKSQSKKRYKKLCKCSECGTDFERRSDQINRRNGSNYCSRKCQSTANSRMAKGRVLETRRTGEYISCKQCNQKFYAPPRRLKLNVQFCSRKCLTESNKQNPVAKGFITKIDNRGEKNGRYKHGNRVGEHVTKPKVRKAVVERDGNWCLMCGRPGPGLHLHRVVYGSQGGKYEVTNCVQLCAVHHEEVHTSKKKWLPILHKHIIGDEQYQDKYLIPSEEAK